MDPFSIISGGLGLAKTGLDIFGSTIQAKGERLAGKYQKQVADSNAAVLDAQADDALDRGEKKSSQTMKNKLKVQAAQRAGTAAGGVDINSGSAMALTQETEYLAQEDVNQIKANAWQEMWGYRAQASDMRFQGSFAEATARQNAALTLLTGGSKAVGNAASTASNVYNIERGGR